MCTPNRRPVRRLAVARERDRRARLSRHAVKCRAAFVAPYSDEACDLDAAGWPLSAFPAHAPTAIVEQEGESIEMVSTMLSSSAEQDDASRADAG